MLVQGEHQTRQYDKTIQVPNGNLMKLPSASMSRLHKRLP